ncbi:carbohydrate ABC transporter permease (plasmid) [Rhizobium sp. CB3060]|uniref:carbohydrate ABC transporter permease n=1 Tax=Rhizobium sp. CB3060 TaxID=3138255 RepID=UPI0021A2AC4D|nr:carbohydrate ABC transporter permease [Rhizobium tropici]UWU26116.1 carbohydrate ABC transporter permease [Rhizobium tropici]
MTVSVIPNGPKPKSFSMGRAGVYAFLVAAAAFFLVPLWVTLVTSFKSMDEVRLGTILAIPTAPTMEPWFRAWMTACTGLSCEGLHGAFLNSVVILVPSVICSIVVGSVTGYAMTFYRVRGANLLFALLLIGAFIPYQVFLFPLIRIFAAVGIYNSLFCIVLVHVIFGLPLMTLLFRNYYSALPVELFNAGRVDGAGFLQIFVHIILPMSAPVIIVATILQVTGIWNDFIFGLTFAGRDNMPMTVLLNNIVNSTQGERAYNVNMAATVLTALVPLIVYLVSGRWFVRGVAAGAVKG